MWLAALIMGVQRPFSRTAWRRLEFWWSFAAVVIGGLGTLATFGLIPANGDSVALIRVAPFMLVGFAMVLSSLVHRPVITVAGMLLIGLFAIYIIFALDGAPILMPLVSLLTLLPAIIVPRDGYSVEALRLGIAWGLAAFLLILALLVVSLPDALIGTCRFDKCSMWGEALGAMGTGNALGLYLAAAGPISLLTARTFSQYAFIGVGSYLLVDLTSSRSAQISWWVGVTVATIFLASQRWKLRWPVVASAIAVASAVIALPLITWSPGSFTGRVELWSRAFAVLAESPLVGRGPSYWVAQDRTVDLDANYATHNLFTELLVSGGVLGTALVVTSLIAIVAGARGRNMQLYVLSLAAIWAASSLTEVVSAPGRVYLVPGLLALVMIAGHARETEAHAARTPRQLSPRRAPALARSLARR